MTETSGTDENRSRTSGPERPVWLLVLVVVGGAYVVVLASVGLEDATAAITRGSVTPLVGAALLEAVVVLMWAAVYRSSVHAVGGEMEASEALNVSMPAFTLSHTLPGGGWAGNALAVKRLNDYGLSGPAAAASVALTATISLTTIAALGASGILVAVVAGDLPRAALVVAVPALIALLLVVVAIVTILRSPKTGDRIVNRIGRLHDRLEERVDDWRSSLRGITEDPPSSQQLWRIAGWALVKWSADIGALALVFVAFGQTPRVSALLVGFGVTQLATAIPVTPGGVGFAEGGMIGAFVALGTSLSVATAVVLTYRVLATWLPAIAGVPLLLRRPRAGG